MGIFGRKKTSGLMDEIRCDEMSYLIWKWHPVGTKPGESVVVKHFCNTCD